MNTDRYDIAAETPGSVTEPEFKMMLQGLLADRFQLAVHRETKQMSLYALLPGKKREVQAFLEGFPERYLTTRSPEQIRLHFDMAQRFDQEPMQIEFQHGQAINEITVVTRDRPSLFAGIAGALAAWGMNVVSIEAGGKL